MADPSNVFAIDDIRSLTGLEVRPVVATRADVLAAIDRVLPRRRRRRRPARAILDVSDDEDDLSNVTRGRRGRADRQVRQPADHPGGPGPRLRHPHRADRARPAGPLPHRRRAARGHALAEDDPGRRHQPAQDHGRHQHRRAPRSRRTAACRSTRHGTQDRPARRDAADGVGREGRHADPRQLHGPPRPDRPRASPTSNYERYSRDASPSRTG